MKQDTFVWPHVLTIEGVEYEHRCHPSRNALWRTTWRCPCGLVWNREGKGLWRSEGVS